MKQRKTLSQCPIWWTDLINEKSTDLFCGTQRVLCVRVSRVCEQTLVPEGREFFVSDPNEEEILRKSIVAPGLEIPDSRFKNWFPNLSLGEIIADKAVAGRIVVGEPVKELLTIDWENIKVSLFLDDEKLDEGYSSAVLGNPIRAVSWLSRELALQGKRLTEGMVVSSGTFILPKPLRKGTYKAVFDSIGEVILKVK